MKTTMIFLHQNWIKAEGGIRDPINGFTIQKNDYDRYDVRWKGKKVGEAYTVGAAKLIANIVLNDYIEFKKGKA